MNVKKRAAVDLSFESLARLLNLRDGLAITGVKVCLDTETVRFYLSGDELPPCSMRMEVRRFPLATFMDHEIT